MICNRVIGGGMVVFCSPILNLKPTTRFQCLASNAKTTAERLRSQLEQLQAEAESTRAKANNARLRLMRLSEAAEKLKLQAAISVHSGKEDDARELLFQKKKIMHAMEKSKNRIEVLDKLSAKLNEAISVKESQLIGNIAFDFEVDRQDDSSPVRIISPQMQEVRTESNEDEDLGSDGLKLTESQRSQSLADVEASPPVSEERGTISVGISNDDSIIRGLKDIASYEDFLEHLDSHLNGIEAQLITILNVSAFVMNDNQMPKNSKVQQTIDLLESIRAIRQKRKSLASRPANSFNGVWPQIPYIVVLRLARYNKSLEKNYKRKKTWNLFTSVQCSLLLLPPVTFGLPDHLSISSSGSMPKTQPVFGMLFSQLQEN